MSKHHFNSYNFVDCLAPYPDSDPSRFELVIRQQPQQARQSTPNERDKKPVDPPPIIQIRIHRHSTDQIQKILQSPYYFMTVTLANPSQPSLYTPTHAHLAGTMVSSLYRLKDVDNCDGGFFVFGDLSVKTEGVFRLKFSLFEVTSHEVQHITSTLSEPFTVFATKKFPGMLESTFLSRSFSDQGVRMRIRKEHRIQAPNARKRRISDDETETLSQPSEETGSRKMKREESHGSMRHPHRDSPMTASSGYAREYQRTYSYPDQPLPPSVQLHRRQGSGPDSYHSGTPPSHAQVASSPYQLPPPSHPYDLPSHSQYHHHRALPDPADVATKLTSDTHYLHQPVTYNHGYPSPISQGRAGSVDHLPAPVHYDDMRKPIDHAYAHYPLNPCPPSPRHSYDSIRPLSDPTYHPPTTSGPVIQLPPLVTPSLSQDPAPSLLCTQEPSLDPPYRTKRSSSIDAAKTMLLMRSECN